MCRQRSTATTRDTMQRSSDPGGASITAIEIENFPRPRFRGTVYTSSSIYIRKSPSLSFSLLPGILRQLLISRAELFSRVTSVRDCS